MHTISGGGGDASSFKEMDKDALGYCSFMVMKCLLEILNALPEFMEYPDFLNC